MESLNELPKVRVDARTDLAGNVPGRFSPADWDLILIKATELLAERIAAGENEVLAWAAVVRQFHREDYWGFRPNWRPPASPNKGNLGFGLIWMTFSTFVLTLMALAWLGQNYTSSDEPKDAYLFFGALTLALLNFVYFLWRSRGHRD